MTDRTLPSNAKLATAINRIEQWADGLQYYVSQTWRRDVAEAGLDGLPEEPGLIAEAIRDDMVVVLRLLRTSDETGEHRDAERYRYLRERVPFDRMIVRRTRVNDHGTTVYETLRGADLDREIDECTGASEKAGCSHAAAIRIAQRDGKDFVCQCGVVVSPSDGRSEHDR